MAITPSALVRPSSAAQASKKAYYDYPYIKRPTTGIFEIIKIEEKTDEKYGDEKYGFIKLNVLLRRVIPGWEKALDSKAEQEVFLQKGHGQLFSVEFNPVFSPPGVNRTTGEPTKESSLYGFIKNVYFDGETPTPAQLGDEVSAEALHAWVAEYNKANPDAKIEPSQAKPYYKAQIVSDILAKLVAEKRFVQASIEPKTSAAGRQYNRVKTVIGSVAADEAPEHFQFYPAPVDPREENDDKDLNCAQCGSHIRGYERRVDGVWVSNTEAAEASEETYGEPLCGKCVWAAKQALSA
jgi:hypothetical protein